MNTIKIQHGSTKMIAHRGLSGIELENTNAAFVAAGNRSYFGIETDVHVTSDDRFIIIHDNNTKRVATDNIVVEESRFDTLQKIILPDTDGYDRRIDLHLPSLEDYLRTCKRYGKTSVLELKEVMKQENVLEIVNIIRDLDRLDDTIFISFVMKNLEYVRLAEQNTKVQFLTGDSSMSMLDELKNRKMDIDINYNSVTEEFIREAHCSGIEVNCWTVNDVEAANSLISWNVDYITTNILE